MAFPIIPKKRSGATGSPTSLTVGELAVNTQTGELFLGGDSAVLLLNPPTAAGTTVTETTGDGTTTAFTFTGYNGTADGGYLVSVGGIDQPPSTYSISSTAGGTITFVEAPVDGELISIRAIVAGSGGGGGTDIGGRAWSATETYTEGDLVATAQRETWICIQAANTNHDPTTSPLWWQPMPADAVSLQLVPVATTTPTTGQGLVYDGAAWAPATPTANATQLQGTAIVADPIPNALEVLTWAQDQAGSGAFEWRPRTLTGNSIPTEGQTLVYNATAGWLSGDVDAVKLTGTTVSTTDPTTAQALVYSGTEWAPADVNAAKLQGKPVSSAAPATGNLLRFDGTNWVPFDGYAIPNWNASISYVPGDNVWYNGKIWNCVAPISTQPPGPSTAGQWVETLGINSGTPSNTSSPVAWVNVQTSAGQGWLPIYQ